MERTPGIELFQIAQTAPDSLNVRLRTRESSDAAAVMASVRGDLAKLLAQRDLGNVRVVPDDTAPQQSAGGRFRTVVPFEAARLSGGC